jgi:hypothetical protein
VRYALLPGAERGQPRCMTARSQPRRPKPGNSARSICMTRSARRQDWAVVPIPVRREVRSFTGVGLKLPIPAARRLEIRYRNPCLADVHADVRGHDAVDAPLFSEAQLEQVLESSPE